MENKVKELFLTQMLLRMKKQVKSILIFTNKLGWLPETKFEDGIKKTIKWYLENREWWETIISGEYQNYYEKMYSNR